VVAALGDRIDERLRAEIEVRVARATGGTATLEGLDVRWMRLAAVAHGVRVHVPATPGTDAEPLTVEIDRIRVRLALRGLLAFAGGRVHLAEAEIDRPRVVIDQAWLDALPRDGTRERGFEARVDRLDVRGGSFRYLDREIPVDVGARDAEIAGLWSTFRRSLIGRVRATADLRLDLFRDPYPVTVEAGIRLNAARLEVFEGRAHGPGIDLELRDQVVSWDGPTFLTADGEARADLDVLAALLADAPDGLGGRVEGPVACSLGGGPVQVRGELRASDFTLGPVRIPSARVDAVLDPGIARFEVREAEGLGGTLRGRVDVGFRGGTTLDVDVRGERIAASAVLAVLDLPLALSAAGDARLRFRGDPHRPESWTADGDFRLDAVAGPGGRIPVSGAGSFTIADGALSLAVPQADMAATTLRVSLDQDLLRGHGALRLDGTTTDAGTTRDASLVVLSGLGVELPDWLRAPWSGDGSIAVTAELGGGTDVTLEMDLGNGAWDGEAYRRLGLGTRIREDEVAVTRLDAIGMDWFVRGSLVVDPERATVRSADAEWVEVPIDVALRRAGLDAPALGGTTSGAIAVREGPDGIQGTGRARIRGVEYRGERIDEADAAFIARADRAVFTDLSATGPAVRVRGDLDVDLADRSARLAVAEGVVELGKLAAVASSGLAVDARLDISGSLELREEVVVGRLDLRGREWVVGDRSLPGVEGSVTLSPTGAEIVLGAREGDRWAVRGNVVWNDDLDLDATLDLRKLGIDLIRDPSAPSARATLSGRVEVRGPAARPDDLVVDGTLTETELRVGARTLRAVGDVPVDFETGRWSLGPARFEGRGSAIDVAVEADRAGDHVDGAARGFLDLGVLSGLIPGVSASGRVDVDVRFSGPAESIRTRGRVDVARGRVRFPGFDQPFEDVALVVNLDGNEAEIADLRAILGGGELRGSGGILLDGVGVDSYRLEIDAANVRVAYPEHFRAVYEGELVLRGDAEAAQIGGALRMLRGEYTEPMDLASLVGSSSREYSTAEELSLPARVYLDVDLGSDGNVWMRNDLVEAEADFDLHLSGDLLRPEVLGRVRAFEGGQIRFRDVEYRIETATLDFVDLQRIDPYLNLRARTRVKEYEVELHVEGTLDRFTYELTSNPVLSQQDIIALLTTGRTIEELSATGGSQAFTGDLAAGYFAGALTGRFERQLQELLRVERLQISPLLIRGSGDPTTRVTLGKEVADDLLLIYSTEIGGTESDLYQMEWRASRKFRLTAERDTLGGIGGEVLYADHFWWRKPPTPDYGRREGIARGSAETGATLGTIDIAGVPPEEAQRLRERLGIATGEPYRRSSLFEASRNLRAWYVRRDRIEARVEVEAHPRPDDPERVDVAFLIDPGPSVEIEFVGVDGRHKKRILSRLRSRWDDTLFTDALFDDSASAIDTYWRERGHYTVQTRVEIEDLPDRRRKAIFRVDPGKPVRIDEIVLEGNREIDRDRIEKQMLTRAGRSLGRRLLIPAVLEEDVRAIRNLYRDQGFLQVDVAPPVVRLAVDGESARVIVRIREGERASIAALTVEEPPAEFDVDTLLGWSELRVGEVFAPRRLIEAESALRAALDRLGYPDARVNVRAERSGNDVAARIQVVPGGRRMVGAVEVNGNFTTKNRIVTREMALTVGDPISRDAILRTQHALYRLGIFRNVRIDYRPMEGTDPEACVLRIDVEEAPPFGVTFGVGYDSEARYKASIGISHANVGGRDRTLSLQARTSSIEQRVQLLAEEPRLFGWRLPALLTLLDEHREQPEFTEDRRSAAFRVERRFSERWTSYLRYSYQRVDLSDVQPTALDTLKEQKLENLVLGDVGVSAIRDTRDDPFSPRSGTLVSSEVRWFAAPLLSQADFVKTFSRYSVTHTFDRGSSVAGGVRLGVSVPYGGTAQVPLSERFFAGGDSTLRGFPRDAVLPEGGEALFLVNAEWRVPLWKSLRGVLFYDTGNVYPRASDLDPTDLRHVLGLGVRFETPIGPLRFEYGHKLDRREGESSGEYFIAIGSAF